MIRAAFYITVLLDIVALVTAVFRPVALLAVVIFTVAAIGIRRSRAWSAYGLALLTVSTIVCGGIILYRDGPVPMSAFDLAAPAVFQLLFAAIWVAAGWRMRAQSPRGWAWPWVALSACLILFPLVVRLFIIPTGAMENTILIGDHLVVSRSAPATPARGDIVVFRYPINPRQTFIKRVVALPGDRLRIASKKLFINGREVREPYVIHKTAYMDSYRDYFPSEPNVRLYEPAQAMLASNVDNGELVVPPGKLFVMGDNRDSSLDSRYWGFLDPAGIIGRPLFVYYSVDLPERMSPREQDAAPVLLNPHWIRWSRLGTLF